MRLDFELKCCFDNILINKLNNKVIWKIVMRVFYE